MRPAIVTILIALAGAAVGCGGDGGTSGGNAEPQQPTAEAETAAISAPCQTAMAAYHEALVTLDNPDEGPLQVATLKACKSREEWLAGVQPYSEGDGCIACAAPEDVYQAMCGDRKKLPACRQE